MEDKKRLSELGIMSVKNPEYGSNGAIVCEVVFSDEPSKTYGFAATESDPVEYGRLIYGLAVAGAFGDIAEMPEAKKAEQKQMALLDKISDSLNFAEQRINDLRRAVDEVEYGLIEDTAPSYRELLGRWVRYRKQLNDFDAASGAAIPSAPADK